MGVEGRFAAAASGVVMALVAGVGCAQQSDIVLVTAAPEDFAATPEFVAEAVTRSTEQSFRYEMSMSMQMNLPDEDIDLDMDAVVATGAQDGDRSQMTMDFGAMFDQMIGDMGEDASPPFDPDDLGMEMVADGETMYMRAPYFAALADELPSSDELDVGAGDDEVGAAFDLFEVFADLGDRWARIDLGALSEALPGVDPNAMPTGQSFDPMALFDVVAGSDAVQDLGTSEIDGVPVHGLAASVSLSELQAAQGASVGGIGPQAEVGDAGAAEALDDLELPVEVWVDDDGLVRRLRFTLGIEQLGGAAAALDEVGGDGTDIPDEALDALDELVGAFHMEFGFDFSDYGDPSIEVELPDEADTVDVTDAYVEAMRELTES